MSCHVPAATEVNSAMGNQAAWLMPTKQGESHLGHLPVGLGHQCGVRGWCVGVWVAFGGVSMGGAG